MNEKNMNGWLARRMDADTGLTTRVEHGGVAYEEGAG